jgi:hypothetical protein
MKRSIHFSQRIVIFYRRLFGARKFRRAGAAGSKPSWHIPLTRGNLKIRFKSEISDEQWQWLCAHGWRPSRTGADRRRYRRLASKIVGRLLDTAERDSAQDRIVRYDIKRRKRLGIPVESFAAGEARYNYHIVNTMLGAEARVLLA